MCYWIGLTVKTDTLNRSGLCLKSLGLGIIRKSKCDLTERYRRTVCSTGSHRSKCMHPSVSSISCSSFHFSLCLSFQISLSSFVSLHCSFFFLSTCHQCVSRCDGRGWVFGSSTGFVDQKVKAAQRCRCSRSQGCAELLSHSRWCKVWQIVSKS